jgi:uncharacterized protein (DUF305 family)
MNPKKFFIIIAVIAVLLVVFLVVGGTGSKDNSKSLLEEVIFNSQDIVDMSNEAAKNASTYNVQLVAANVAATTLSDLQNLRTLYEEQYGGDPPKARKVAKGQTKKDYREELTKTQPGIDYDNYFINNSKSLVEQNLTNLKAARSQSNIAEIQDVIKQVLSNQTEALNKLNDPAPKNL